MNTSLRIIASIAAGLSLAACGANPNSPTSPTGVAPIAQNVLQFAVGTANLEGTSALNVVSTYRQPSGSYAPGDSGALTDSVTLSGLGVVPANAGAAPNGYDPLSTAQLAASADSGTGALTSSSQNPGTTTVTTFGQSGGAFGLGIEQYNAIGPASQTGSTFPGEINSPFQVAPYQVPMLDTVAKDPNAFVPWGGPPAFVLPNSGGDSPVGNGLYPGGTAGVSEGINVLYGVAPRAGGTYTLAVSVPANTGTVSQSANATLASIVTLPTPVAPAFTPDGNGGGTFTGFAVAAPAIEAYVQVIDYGPATGTSCNGASTKSPLYYTIETTSTPAALPDAIGPGGAASTCTAAANTTANGTATGGDQVVVQAVTFDYKAFEMSYPNSLKNPSPTISNGPTDDLAVSVATCTIVNGGSCAASLPLLRARRVGPASAMRVIKH